MSMFMGLNMFNKFIPPYKVGSCIVFDYSKIDDQTDLEPNLVRGVILRNAIQLGISEILVTTEIFPGVEFASYEVVSFKGLRMSDSYEVPCD